MKAIFGFQKWLGFILIDENDNGMMKMIDIQILYKQQLYSQTGWTKKQKIGDEKFATMLA